MTTQAPPSAPGETAYPDARLVTVKQSPDLVTLESKSQARTGAGIDILEGEVVIHYKDRTVEADHIEYDSGTGDLTATGHLVITRASDNLRIVASHGTYNLRTETGRFYDVSGSIGLKPATPTRRAIYTTTSPFLFNGKVVVKTGPRDFDVYEGTVTSCQLPRPDWLLSADHFSVDSETARAKNSIFHLLNFPILYLPYVTHPVDSERSESGFLIPTIGVSNTKGIVLGEQIYFTLGRSFDMTFGADYYSSIGWAQMATLRFRGAGLDFGILHYSGVLDRRTGTANQGGEEVILAGRHDFSSATRAATNIDYLSSYTYREAFSDNFNQAVTSDIVSTVYATHQSNGLELGALADRYQGIKLIAFGTTPQQQVRIFHVPTLSFATTDHLVPGTASKFSTGLEVSLDSAAAGLKRSQPNFVTGGIIERFDLHPQLSYPLSFAQWHILPEFGGRETVYSRSRLPPAIGQPLTESQATLTRSDFEFALGVLPPVLTRTFAPTRFTRLLGSEVRHTIEPEFTYRLVDGVNNFNRILRFDTTDVVSNTNEAEYGVTQRLFRRRAVETATPDKPCSTEIVAQAPGFSSLSAYSSDDMTRQIESHTGICPSEELISWRLTQKYFFDQTFGAAIADGRRNIFSTTLDLSGVAFVTAARELSPLISRLRFRTSAHTDIEWDFDLDTGARKFNSSNVYLDLHQGNRFAAVSYARLDAPGRFYTESPNPNADGSTSGVNSSISDFNQLRLLAGYGNPTKSGLSIAANTGIDLKSLYGTTQTTTNTVNKVTTTTTTTVYPALLQYATVQGSYNWNCCGLAVEYRKFELGSVRNEGSYRFSFTLANIGAAGNLRRAERLF